MKSNFPDFLKSSLKIKNAASHDQFSSRDYLFMLLLALTNSKENIIHRGRKVTRRFLGNVVTSFDMFTTNF